MRRFCQVFIFNQQDMAGLHYPSLPTTSGCKLLRQMSCVVAPVTYSLFFLYTPPTFFSNSSLHIPSQLLLSWFSGLQDYRIRLLNTNHMERLHRGSLETASDTPPGSVHAVGLSQNRILCLLLDPSPDVFPSPKESEQHLIYMWLEVYYNSNVHWILWA